MTRPCTATVRVTRWEKKRRDGERHPMTITLGVPPWPGRQQLRERRVDTPCPMSCVQGATPGTGPREENLRTALSRSQDASKMGCRRRGSTNATLYHLWPLLFGRRPNEVWRRHCCLPCKVHLYQAKHSNYTLNKKRK